MPYTTDALILLYVNTANIINFTNDQTQQVLGCVYLADNQGDIDPDNKSNYTTYLSGNSQIAWAGAVLNMTPGLKDYVLISDITFKSGKNGIGIQKRPKQNGSGDTHIDAFFTGNIPSGTETDYTISFSVFRDGDTVGKDYSIDPKLIMR